MSRAGCFIAPVSTPDDTQPLTEPLYTGSGSVPQRRRGTGTALAVAIGPRHILREAFFPVPRSEDGLMFRVSGFWGFGVQS